MRTKGSCWRLASLWGGLVLAALCAMPVTWADTAFAQAARPANGLGTPFELTFWQSVDSSGDPAQYDEYLRQYPGGTFSALARLKIASLRKNAAPAAEPVVTLPQPNVVAPAVAPQSAPAPAGLVSAAYPVPAAASAPAPAPAAPPAAPPAVTAGQGAPAAAGDQTSELAGLLALLASTQENAPPGLPNKIMAAAALPPYPKLAPVPEVTFPAAFCSAEARNAFHDQIYQTALSAAKGNNDTATAYLRQLQGIYDGYQLGRDTSAMNELAAQARAYQPEAARAFDVQTALVGKFPVLMAVPIQPCKAAK